MDTLPSSLAPLLARLPASGDVSSPTTTLPPLQLRRSPSVKPFNPSLTPLIDSFIDDTHKTEALRAVLHLVNDDLERAHDIAQENEGDMSCNLCHAILHRREGDFWNSCWWLDRISHPLLEEVHGGRAGAKRFVKAVEAIVSGGSGVGSRNGGAAGSSTACGAQRLDELKRLQATIEEVARVHARRARLSGLRH